MKPMKSIETNWRAKSMQGMVNLQHFTIFGKTRNTEKKYANTTSSVH